MGTDLSYFDGLDAQQREIALALHAKVAGHGPDLVRKLRWNMPSFVGQGDIVSVTGAGKGDNADINLQFFFGAHLPNPFGLIEGTGKNLRHIKFFGLDDIEREGVDEAIAAAIAYDRSR